MSNHWAMRRAERRAMLAEEWGGVVFVVVLLAILLVPFVAIVIQGKGF